MRNDFLSLVLFFFTSSVVNAESLTIDEKVTKALQTETYNNLVKLQCDEFDFLFSFVKYPAQYSSIKNHFCVYTHKYQNFIYNDIPSFWPHTFELGLEFSHSHGPHHTRSASVQSRAIKNRLSPVFLCLRTVPAQTGASV